MKNYDQNKEDQKMKQAHGLNIKRVINEQEEDDQINSKRLKYDDDEQDLNEAESIAE